MKPAATPESKAVPAKQAGDKTRLGFLEGQADVPDDFDDIGAGAIRALFEGDAPRSTPIRAI